MGTRYCRSTDLLTTFSSVTLAAGTASTDPNYALASLSDLDLSKPLKLVDGSPVGDVRITWDHGSATRVDGFLLPKHNLDENLAVLFQRNATDDWDGSPGPSQSVALSIKAVRPGNPGHSRSPWVDLTTEPGYSAGGFRYSSLFIPSNSVAPKLKAFLIAQWRVFDHGLLGTSVVVGHGRGFIPAIKTAYGVTTYYDQNVVQRAVKGQLYATPDDWQELQDLADDCSGCVSPFAFVLDDTVTDDGGLLVRMSESMAAGLSAEYRGPDVRPVTLDLLEVSRGLPY
jgi:hypothetical protein